MIGCKSDIKNRDASVLVEEGTEVTDSLGNDANQPVSDVFIGAWVDDFEADKEDPYDSYVYVDEGFIWNRNNKINLSIDEIADSTVIGHSVVAGNKRSFKGTLKNSIFHVKEPGDNKYDGEFIFEIENDTLKGVWNAYKAIEIPHRKYELVKKSFSYNPDIMLEKNTQYVNWNNFEKENINEIEDDEFGEWIVTKFASTTDKIYKINASNTLLTKKEVENLKKGDLFIIRNTIYARHGYSFKNRPLRIFFDAQSWYIPMHANIQSDFTEIEKKNIQLLLRYEENAEEYYDYFGRG